MAAQSLVHDPKGGVAKLMFFYKGPSVCSHRSTATYGDIYLPKHMIHVTILIEANHPPYTTIPTFLITGRSKIFLNSFM
eukprot:3301670-Amphidinium_carterae.1